MSTLKIGWASRDVSVEGPVVITGQAHQRLSNGIKDPITTTALVLDHGEGNMAVFVCLDGVGIGTLLVDEVRAKTKALRPEIVPETIIINATHAHTGICHYDDKSLFAASDDPQDQAPLNFEHVNSDDTRHWLSDTMAAMIAEAWDKRAEGGVAYGYGYAVVAHSRRVIYADDVSTRPGAANGNNTYAINGHGVMYGNTNDDQFSGYEAGADHFINLLYTFDPSGKLTGAVINVPCPCQLSEGMWYLTASFWAETRRMLREKYGDIFILTQCAAGGDLSPRILHYKKAQARRFRLKFGDRLDGSVDEQGDRFDIAERITEAFGEVLSWAKKDIRADLPLEHRVDVIQLDRTVISEEQYKGCIEGLAELRATPFHDTGDAIQDMVFNSTLVSNRRRMLAAIRLYENYQKGDTKRAMELHVIRAGDIAFVTCDHELYMDFQHRIQARSPFEQTFLVQLCGQPSIAGSEHDFQYYLCTQRGLENKGYSASIFCTRVSPEGGQQMVDEAVRVLKELTAE